MISFSCHLASILNQNGSVCVSLWRQSRSQRRSRRPTVAFGCWHTCHPIVRSLARQDFRRQIVGADGGRKPSGRALRSGSIRLSTSEQFQQRIPPSGMDASAPVSRREHPRCAPRRLGLRFQRQRRTAPPPPSVRYRPARPGSCCPTIPTPAARRPVPRVRRPNRVCFERRLAGAARWVPQSGCLVPRSHRELPVCKNRQRGR
jgi:hypothetical protein